MNTENTEIIVDEIQSTIDVKKENKRKIILGISIVLVITSLAILGIYFIHRKLDEKLVEDLKETITETETDNKEEPLRYYLINDTVVQEKYKDIFLKNTDFIGWITIDNVGIDYPVVYTPEDYQYYLRKDFNKNPDIAGTIFAQDTTDIVRPSENIILYGHNMRNGSMFHNIKQYEDEDFYKSHKYITFNTLNRNSTYEIVAAFKTVAHNKDYEGFDLYQYVNMERHRFNEFMDYVKKSKTYDAVDFNYGDHLITLSTCYRYTYNGRFVVIAKEIESQEVDMSLEPIDVIYTDDYKVDKNKQNSTNDNN